MTWADDEGISGYSFLDCLPSDENQQWETKNNLIIDYCDLETSHIANIINKFKFTKKTMPNLLKEFKRRNKMKNKRTNTNIICPICGRNIIGLSQSSVDFINNLLDNEYNSTDMDDEYRDEIQDVQAELDEIPVICKIKEEK